MAKQTRKASTQYGRALVQPASLDTEAREVDVVFATETPVPRFGWEEDYDEVLVCEAGAIRMERANRGLPVMDCHNTWSVFAQLGRTVKVWINERRELCARIKFSQRAQVAELFQDITDGIVKDISVGYNVFKFERVEQPGGKNPIYRAIDWMPTELSFAPVQADINSEIRGTQRTHTVEIISNKPQTTTMSKRVKKRGQTTQYVVTDEPVKAGDIITVDGVEGVALADGEVGDEITLSIIEQPTPNEEEGGRDTGTEEGNESENAVSHEEDTGDDDSDDDEQHKDSRQRMSAITRATRAAGLPDSYAIELFHSKKTIDQCRAAVIEKLAKRNPKPNGVNGIGVGLEAGTKKRAAVQNVLLHRIYPAKFSLDAGAREYRGMTLVELGKELLAGQGINTRGMDKMTVADRIFKRSHSTGDFPLLLEGVIDKMLREQYEFAPEYWDKIARRTSVADFREKGLYMVGGANGMKRVAEGGEIKYTTLKESKSTIRVESYAEGIMFTRQAFINDDLSAFAIVPSSFVRDWEILRGDMVWGLIVDNAKMSDGKAMFCADHGNLLSGTDSALSEESLAAAKVLLSKQKDLAGKTIRVLPKYLIVPPELEITAKKLVTATTPAKVSDVNVFANEFDIIVEPRLTDPKSWYLSADPNTVDTLYYAYLEGNEALRVNSEEDFNTDTMKYAVRGDFGASAIDHRGMVKAAGK
ncbi:MAG: Mu-like prophage major head subunit gpT family protein [Rikenella sp.]|nr:Mu-like prophage major head subunit gpT family protein [Rikenella sp.]